MRQELSNYFCEEPKEPPLALAMRRHAKPPASQAEGFSGMVVGAILLCRPSARC